ncbi:MAG: sodium:proton antiporter [Proteobacteria bacterium]|nr:sodium:proton antiporter [Pseudomonadota bacterium]
MKRIFPYLSLFFFFLLPERLLASEGGELVNFPVWSGVFFIVLLLSIAIIPLINAEWWSRRYGWVAICLAIPAGIIVVLKKPSLLIHTIGEYLSFIILLGSLFVIAGGIVIRIGAKGTPKLNAIIIALGAFFASFIGTTGASMVLIRPLIRANQWRKHVVHIYIFFIFLVSNIGGLLTPLGDPPLFLGFLKGVPFFWTFKLFPFWLFSVGILVFIFILIDNYYLKKEDPEAFNKAIPLSEKRLEIKGKRNIIFLLLVIASFFLPPIFREALMIVSALMSIYFTPITLREENAFTYHPIIEVALLFIGIFVTMVPVMKMLELNGSKFGIEAPWQFFWTTGALSSFLDNAPTYLVFMATAQSVAVAKNITTNLIVGVPEIYLRAISVGAVFMGANSYIGNGPNFMVKAICEENDIKMPSFFGYMAWSCGILIPLFILITFVFFK